MNNNTNNKRLNRGITSRRILIESRGKNEDDGKWCRGWLGL